MLWTNPYQWVNAYAVQPQGIALDSAGKVYIAGTIDQDTTAGGSNDVLLSQWSPTTAGAPLWVRQRGTTSQETVGGLAIDSDDTMYVVGSTSGTLDGNGTAGSDDTFLMQFDAQGAWQWTEQWGTTALDQARGVIVGADGNIYVVGATNGAFGGYTSAGFTDNFVTRWQSDRTRDWTVQWGTANLDAALGIVGDASNNLYVVASQSDIGFSMVTDLIVSKLYAQ